MTYVRLRPGTTYVNVDELPSGTDLYLVGLTARQLHIARSWCFPSARASGRLVRPLGADLYELATDAEVSDYTDDLDGLEDALGGVPQMLLWAGTGDIEDVGLVEAAGDALTVPHGDHVHAIARDTAKVTQLVDSGDVPALLGAAASRVSFPAHAYASVSAHLTGSLANGGAVAQVFTAVYATGLLIVGCSVSSIAGIFACARGSCVALGTLPVNTTNVKGTANKLNIYNDGDSYVYIENNYSTALILKLMWLSCTGNVGLNTAI